MPAWAPTRFSLLPPPRISGVQPAQEKQSEAAPPHGTTLKRSMVPLPSREGGLFVARQTPFALKVAPWEAGPYWLAGEIQDARKGTGHPFARVRRSGVVIPA